MYEDSLKYLQRVREYFDDSIKKAIDSRNINFLGRILESESEADLETRQNELRLHIFMQRLKPYEKEIIAGMRKSHNKIFVLSERDELEELVYEYRNALHRQSNELLKFGLDYINRWKMYNSLFNFDTKS